MKDDGGDSDRVKLAVPVVAGATVSETVVLAVRLPEVPVMVTVDVPVVAVELALSVSALDPAVGFVPKEAVTPLGKPDAANVTLPENPLTSSTAIVLAPAALPCVRETLAGEADRVKLGVSSALTVSETVVLAVRLPEVPVMVTVDAPVVAVELAVNVSALEPVVGFVPKDAVTPLGKPDAASVTLPENPPAGSTAIVLVPAAPPCVMETLAGEADRVKLGDASAVTLSETVVLALRLPEVPVMVTVAAPVAAEELAVNVSALEPEVGLVPKDAVTPLGKPDAANVTVPENPPAPSTVIVLVPAAPPCVIETLAGEAASVKLGVDDPASNVMRALPFGLPQPVTRS